MQKLRLYQSEILEKTRAAYREGYLHPCIVAPCGTGKSLIVAEMARLATNKGHHVLCLEHRQELVEQMTTTLKNQDVNMQLCKVMMVQTAVRRLKKMIMPDLIITDENHHCLAASYRRIYDTFPDTPTVGVTATPCRLNGGGLGDVNDVLIESRSVSWFIENGYLAPFEYYAPALADITGVKKTHGDYNKAEIAELLNKPAIYGDAIAHYKALASGKKAIVYCPSIAFSKRIADEFTQAGIPAAHIDGDTNNHIRKRTIEAFRVGELRILSNVDLISEGFDVPDCACSILLRPTCSLTLHVQQSMRCMRPKPGKTAIIIDHVGNYLRHGMPDEDRAWKLEPKKQNKKRDATDGFSIKQCPRCYKVIPSALRTCPGCGYELVTSTRDIQEIREAALECIKSLVVDYSSSEDCKSYTELLEYAKKRGYKPGWAYYQAKNRGWIHI